MPLILGFIELLAGALLLTSALAQASLADVIRGRADLHRAGGNPAGAGAVAGAVDTSSGGSYGALVSGAAEYAGPDQGIDFTTPAGKTAAIFAPADLLITRVDQHSGWPGGGLIAAQVQSGQHKGRFVYFAESVQPIAGLVKGSLVAAGQQFATFSSSYPGIEAGFAQDASGAAYGTVHDGKPGGPAPVHGISFGNWIKSLAQGHA